MMNFKLIIINKGLSDASFMDIQLDESGFTILSPKKIYIGSLNSDDSDSATFNILFSGSSGNFVNFPVTLTYRDIENKQYTKTFVIDTKVYSQKDAQELGLIKKSMTGLYISIIVILIIVYIIYRKIRKWIKNRKKAKESAS